MASSDASDLFANIPLDGPVVVFDLEWTAWEGSRERNWSGPREEREIIEIGAVKLDGANGLTDIVRFENLVRPTLNPIVSSYFTDLTGITQTLIDNEAMPFRDAITLFASARVVSIPYRGVTNRLIVPCAPATRTRRDGMAMRLPRFSWPPTPTGLRRLAETRSGFMTWLTTQAFSTAANTR